MSWPMTGGVAFQGALEIRMPELKFAVLIRSFPAEGSAYLVQRPKPMEQRLGHSLRSRQQTSSRLRFRISLIRQLMAGGSYFARIRFAG